jgi:hypothetical protein
MSSIDCPVCGFSVNASAIGCPECGADPALPAEQARADLAARGLPLPITSHKRLVWSRRRRLTVTVVAAVAALILLAPLWLGYFGPRTAAYAQMWLPWRSHMVVVDSTPARNQASGRVDLEITYSDPWPGSAASPGGQTRFLTVTRFSPLLPWIVTGEGTGP